MSKQTNTNTNTNTTKTDEAKMNAFIDNMKTKARKANKPKAKPTAKKTVPELFSSKPAKPKQEQAKQVTAKQWQAFTDQLAKAAELNANLTDIIRKALIAAPKIGERATNELITFGNRDNKAASKALRQWIAHHCSGVELVGKQKTLRPRGKGSLVIKLSNEFKADGSPNPRYWPAGSWDTVPVTERDDKPLVDHDRATLTGLSGEKAKTVRNTLYNACVGYCATLKREQLVDALLVEVCAEFSYGSLKLDAAKLRTKLDDKGIIYRPVVD